MTPGPPDPRERRYGGKTAAERRGERRERLLDAGLELFGTAGYAVTTIEALCAAAGLNPRYFYEQFDGREALLGAVYDRHVETVLAHVRAAIDGAPAEPATRLRAGLDAFVTGTLADERAARINYFEMVGVSPGLEARRRGVLRAYADMIVAQGGEFGALDAMPPAQRRMVAVALVGAVDGLVTDWLSDTGRRPPQRRVVDTLLTLFAPIVSGG
jgi:AcrR family transcriptional regulator